MDPTIITLLAIFAGYVGFILMWPHKRPEATDLVPRGEGTSPPFPIPQPEEPATATATVQASEVLETMTEEELLKGLEPIAPPSVDVAPVARSRFKRRGV